MANRNEVLEELEDLALVANRQTARYARFARSIRALKKAVASGDVEPEAGRRRSGELFNELLVETSEMISGELGIDPDVRLN